MQSSDIGKLNKANPCPFKQPFLVLHLSPKKEYKQWVVDVDGRIDPYLNGGDKPDSDFPNDRSPDATPLLKEMARRLREIGIFVYSVHTYTGSAGPSHVLRHGVFFARMSANNDSATGAPPPKWMDQ